MAITRAQQVRQMLEDGGMLVKPSTDGRRPGYRNPNEDRAREEAASNRESRRGNIGSSSKSRNTGPSFDDVSKASDEDRRQTYSAVQTQTGKVKGGGKPIRDYADRIVGYEDDRPSQTAIDNARKFQEEQKQKREEAIKRNRSSNLLNFFDKRKQAYNLARSLPGAAKSSYNNLVAYRDYLKSQGADLTTIDRLLEGVDEETPIGFDAFQELAYGYEPKGITDIETLRGMFTDPTRGPFDKITAVPQNFSDFMLTQRNNPNLFAAGDLGNFMNTPKPKDLVNPNTGELYTNAEWNALKQDIGQDRGLIEGMGGDPTRPDPCKGPNPPAYCNIDPPSDPDDPSTPSTGVFAGIAPRFAGSIFDFDKLRANAMDGGIMNNNIMGGMADGNIDETGRQMYFLGKLVKKATRAVKKVVKSPFGKAAIGAALFGGFGGGGKGLGSFFGKGSFNPLKALITTTGQDGAASGLGLSKLGQIFNKFGMATGEGNLTLGGKIGLGFGIPFALDLLGVGKDDDKKMDLDEYYRTQGINIADIRNNPYNYLADRFRVADGGRINYQEGGDAEPVAKKTMPLIDMDGKEKDYRETGGFVDMGRMERADDVPARLSKNEFVFTADAVRNAGEGDIDKGAEVMYNMMKNLEAGGEVSEESQGLEGARKMFQTSQRLEEVL